MSEGKRVIVTGATGFVGANLARRLLADGYEVHLLVRPQYRPWRIESIRSHVHLHEVSLSDEPGLTALSRDIRPEWVFHLAVHGAYPWQSDRWQMAQTNIIGTMNLVQAAMQAGCEAIVNTGSSSEYGFKDHPAAETEWLDPNSNYAVTKAAATLICRYTARAQGVRIPTLRLYSVYGPYEEPTRLLPTLIVRGLQGEWPPLVDPEVARDYVYVDDVIDAYLLAATCPDQDPGAVYNVGTGVQTSLREVVGVARQVLGIEAEPVWGSMPNRQWDTSTWVADSRSIQERLGWRVHYEFGAGFRRMVDWFWENPALASYYARLC
jgi:UDP-glucose 4-epimerase